jgi:hypothetical protein
MQSQQLKTIHDRLLPTLDFQPIFITVSGAHLYGFESYNSDLDLRGCHYPVGLEFLRYNKSSDTIDRSFEDRNIFREETDLVSHSFFKYLYLLTRKVNGYVLEQLYSPLVIQTSPLQQELKTLGKECICKELKYHYNGFFKNQTQLLTKEKKQVKLVLYQARIIASSVYAAQNGQIEANLVKANQATGVFDEAKLNELIEIKRQGEKNNFPDSRQFDYWQEVISNKWELIEQIFEKSGLPSFNSQKVSTMANNLINRNFQFLPISR